MNVLVATDFRLYKKGEEYYLNETTFITINRYKKTFGNVYLCTRVVDVDEINNKLFEVTSIISGVVRINSLLEVLRGRRNADIANCIKNVDLVICRVPSVVAYKASSIAHKQNKPVLAVAMGCAWDAYFNHGLKGKIIAPYMFFKMKEVLAKSSYALYVTNEFLQKRYPCRCQTNIGVSDVCLTDFDDAILKRRLNKIQSFDGSHVTFVTTGDVESRIKGQNYIFYTLRKLKQNGCEVKYILIGEGKRDFLIKKAKKHGVIDNLVFKGRLNYDQIKDCLDESDIYLQPSLQEGMPRAVLEAMSRALPVVASTVGGMPEIIEGRYLAKKKKIRNFYQIINSLLSQDQLKAQASRNFEKAKEFEEKGLLEKRNKFYEKIIQDICSK